MKVLMINSVCGIRSTGRICTDLAEVLEREGHECKIAYGREVVPVKYQKYAVRIGSELGVKLHAGLSRIFDDAGFHSWFATKKFIRWIEKYDPDVIHLHNLHGYYLHIGLLFRYLKTCNKKIIWTLHDCWAFTGHCSHFTYVGCKKWKTGCFHCIQKDRYPKSIFFDRSKKNYCLKRQLFTGIPNMTVVTPSDWLAGLVKQSFLKEYPIHTINNGIDLTVFKPTSGNFREKYHLLDKKVILGVASGWGERKGFYDFIKLAKLLDDDYRIVLVGVNEEQIKVLPKNIIGIKRTNNTNELAEIYTAADLFLNLSVEETMGLVTVESLACGTLALVYKKTALSEFVDCNTIFGMDNLDLCLVVDLINKYSGKASKFESCLNRAKCFNKTNKFMEYISLYY